MYKIGEFVIYGNEGVCKVDDIGLIDMGSINNNKDYYTLVPIHDNGKVFAPVDTKVTMRPIATKEEIEKAIEDVSDMKEITSKTKNDREVQEYYKNLLKTRSISDLLTVIISIDKKKQNLISNGKKLGQIEEKFIKTARTLIEDEFSVVLDIDKSEVSSYINERIS